MAVKYIELHGTKQEIQDTLNALPKRTTDRILWNRPLFSHMTAHLGIELYDVLLSKVELTPKIMDIIHEKSKQYPRMLYRVTDKHFRLFYELEENWYTNYALEDSQFPGPFGALCRLYGKSYY